MPRHHYEDLSSYGTLVRVRERTTLSPRVQGRLKMSTRKNPSASSAHDSKSRPSTVHKDDKPDENGVWFWVNKNGFPVDDMTWDRMWDHVAKIHPDGHKMVQTVRGNVDCPQIPVPQAPLTFSPILCVADKLDKIQTYMNTLQYNHTGTQFFEIRKNRPITGLLEVAKDMIREALPIKCLEAIILGIFLTNGMMGVERFPISFKTAFNGNVHRHVVLGIYHSGKYGALGMSRRDDLMYKPLVFKTLSELINDFEKSYKKYWHNVKKVKVGLPASHDPHSYECIQWKTLTLNRSKMTQKEMVKEVDAHAKDIRTKGKLNWKTHEEPVPKQKVFIRDETPMLPMYASGRKSRSWSVPQSISPRKSLTFIDLDAARQSKPYAPSTSNQSSFNHAIKVYTGTREATSISKEKESTDLGEYQIRI